MSRIQKIDCVNQHITIKFDMYIHNQDSCWGTYQISEQLNNSKHKSQSFEALENFFGN